VAGPRRAVLTRQRDPLQLALVLELGHERGLQQRKHEIDVRRWGLTRYPVRVESAGGRYHFKDDWECADTQVATFESMAKVDHLEGRSCNGQVEGCRGASRSTAENGSVLIDDHAYTSTTRK